VDILGILLPVVITHACILGVIIVVIKKMLLSDTMQAVDRIKQVEGEVRKKEQAIRREIEEHEKEFERQKAESEANLQKKREESEKELVKMKDQVTADAQKEAENIIQQAKKSEEKIKQDIMQKMEEKAVDYGSEIFKLVFTERMNGALNKQFIDELIEALGEMDASNVTIDGSEMEFTTSHPMDPEQKGRLEKLLEEKFKVNVKIEEKIREELMGGIILKLGSLEIDGSLLNRYQEAAAEVKKTAQV